MLTEMTTKRWTFLGGHDQSLDMVNLRNYVRHSSSTVQKAASYIDVDLRKKTWESAHTGWKKTQK